MAGVAMRVLYPAHPGVTRSYPPGFHVAPACAILGERAEAAGVSCAATGSPLRVRTRRVKGVRMLDSLLTGYPVVVEQAVVWGEMDAYRHVNNVVYFRYFENARLEYFRRLGWPEFEGTTGIGPILAATQARFRKPLTYPDAIAIAAWLGTLGSDRLN